MVTAGCPVNDPNLAAGPVDAACAYLSDRCEAIGQPGGSLTWIWQRKLNPPGRWERIGESCNLPLDDRAAAPVITAGMVERAFRDLPFAKPLVHVQPEGNVTLVNLETFYEVRWSRAGYAPHEVATVELLGARVQIRPWVATYTYDFGDGTTLGPTADAGGPYPGGGVRHTYERRAASVAVDVVATYRGEYRLPQGAWQDIDIDVPVAGPPTAVTVRSAHNRLIAEGSTP